MYTVSCEKLNQKVALLQSNIYVYCALGQDESCQYWDVRRSYAEQQYVTEGVVANIDIRNVLIT